MVSDKPLLLSNVRYVQAGGFELALSSGQHVLAKNVVVATGLSCFAYLPALLASLPPDLVTHTSNVTAFANFRGQSVAVIGAGQSALEAAALLHETGARPDCSA
jgi:cation diffusion facilitator CzcD-associated flavoprotein CzcO